MVSEDTERHLFEKLERGKLGKGRPQDYKEEMLVIMEAFMEQVTKQEEIQSAIQCYERTKSFGNNTILEGSPGKTQNHKVPPHKTEGRSDKSSMDGEEMEEGPVSGQGQP